MNTDPRRGLPSASATYRVANCPGSVALIAEVKERGLFFELSSPAAESGHRGHAWLARRALDRKRYPPHSKNPADELGLNAEELRTVAACEGIRDELLIGWCGQPLTELGPNFSIQAEERHWYRRDLTPLFSAQLDLAVFDHERRAGFIFDYKTGRKEEIDAPLNLQLRAEAVAWKANLPALERIRTAIIEPWVTYDPIQAEYDAASLRKAEAEIVGYVDRSRWERDMRVAGPWCAHCAARAWCEEARAYLASVYSIQKHIDARIIELPRGPQGVRVYESIATARELLDALEDAFKAAIETDPEFLPGYHLHDGHRRRHLTDNTKARAKLKLAGFSDEEIDRCAEFRVAKLEECFADKRGEKLGRKAAAPERAFAELLGDLVQTKTGEPYIAKLPKREREKRAALLVEGTDQ